jgi:hypothetical protein
VTVTWMKVRLSSGVCMSARVNDFESSGTLMTLDSEPVPGRAKCSEIVLWDRTSGSQIVESQYRQWSGVGQSRYDRKELGPKNFQEPLDSGFPEHGLRCRRYRLRSDFAPI